MKKKKTPLQLNEGLIKRARLTSQYSGGDMSTRGTWDVDAMFDPVKEVMAQRMLKTEEDNKKIKEEVNNPNKNNKKNKKDNIEDIINRGENEEKKEEKVIPPEPTKYSTVECDDNTDPDCWMGMKEILTEEWIKWNNEYGDSSAIKQLRSPFKKYSALKTNIRENYIPGQNSPFQQTVGMGPKGRDNISFMGDTTYGRAEDERYNIWKTFIDLPEKELQKRVGNAIANDMSNNEEYGVVLKPIEKLPNKQWRESITEYMGFVKENMINSIKDGQLEYKDAWMSNAQSAITNVQKFINKRTDWMQQMGGDQTLTNKGGSTMSAASHKGDKRQWDLTYLGDRNIQMDLSEEGGIYFKLEGVDDIWSVDDLDANTHNKDYRGLQIWNELKKKLKESASEGIEFNEPAVESVIDGILQSDEAVGSWAHDDLDGESFFDRYYKAAPEEFDINPFMPEHSDYNVELIRDMVKNGMINMAKQTFATYAPKVAKTALTVKQLIDKYRK